MAKRPRPATRALTSLATPARARSVIPAPRASPLLDCASPALALACAATPQQLKESPMTRTARSAAIAALTALAAVAAIIAADLTAPISAQSGDTTGRIVARLLEDGRVEFGWQPSSGARVLPRQRYFPPDATVDRWLRSSPVEVDGAEIGRINARLRSNGRIEFAFTPTDGERIAPPQRYFPADATPNRWLRSTEITIGSPADNAPRYTAVSANRAIGGHTCAIRASSGEIECWGYNHSGQTNAPAGSFTAVSAGRDHTCAIRAGTGAIECWGENRRGVSDAPEGSFTAVSAGNSHTCAIRAGTGEIECWGANNYGQNAAPAGSFTAVSSLDNHICGLRESGAILCWGNNDDGQSDAPAGSYSAVSAGSAHTCAIRESGAIECWGANGSGQTDAPEGSYSAVSAGNRHTCAIRAGTGAIECWGGSKRGTPPDGAFTSISVAAEHICAIRENGTMACWGAFLWRLSDVRGGRFTAVTDTHGDTCGLRENGAIECWSGSRPLTPPDGAFTAISGGQGHVCAIRESSGAIECFGEYNYNGQLDAPAGRFTAVSAGPYRTCGLREDGAIECWGRYVGEEALLGGSFTAVSAGEYHSCAIRENDSAIVCWGGNVNGMLGPGYSAQVHNAPAGSYAAVHANRFYPYETCAIRTDGELVCWRHN